MTTPLYNAVCLFVASGHAKVILDIIEQEGRYRIHGLFDDHQALWGQSLFGYPVLGGKSALKKSPMPLIISIGDNQIRFRLACEFKEKNFSFLTAIHPSASVSRGVTIRDGTVVMAGAVSYTHLTLPTKRIV